MLVLPLQASCLLLPNSVEAIVPYMVKLMRVGLIAIVMADMSLPCMPAVSNAYWRLDRGLCSMTFCVCCGLQV